MNWCRCERVKGHVWYKTAYTCRKCRKCTNGGRHRVSIVGYGSDCVRMAADRIDGIPPPPSCMPPRWSVDDEGYLCSECSESEVRNEQG